MSQRDNLRSARDASRGESNFVIAVVVDVRGFSAFSTIHDSVDVAMYVKRIYSTMLDDYFPFGNFYKPTGDGLLFTLRYDDQTFVDKAEQTVASSIRCVEEFPQITSGDPMINYATPKSIGIGITRGPACCLTTDEEIIDYSGHILNLAARLMDFARPSGVVIDGAFGVDHLSEEIKGQFEPQKVFIRSLAETEPKEIFIQHDVVTLPTSAFKPIRDQWQTQRWETTAGNWRKAEASFQHSFDSTPDPESVVFQALVAKYVDGIRQSTHIHYTLESFHCDSVAGEPWLRMHSKELKEYLDEDGIPDDERVVFVLRYLPAERS